MDNAHSRVVRGDQKSATGAIKGKPGHFLASRINASAIPADNLPQKSHARQRLASPQRLCIL
jgi:hypothetical protein